MIKFSRNKTLEKLYLEFIGSAQIHMIEINRINKILLNNTNEIDKILFVLNNRKLSKYYKNSNVYCK